MMRKLRKCENVWVSRTQCEFLHIIIVYWRDYSLRQSIHLSSLKTVDVCEWMCSDVWWRAVEDKCDKCSQTEWSPPNIVYRIQCSREALPTIFPLSFWSRTWIFSRTNIKTKEQKNSLPNNVQAREVLRERSIECESDGCKVFKRSLLHNDRLKFLIWSASASTLTNNAKTRRRQKDEKKHVHEPTPRLRLPWERRR